MSGKLPNLEAAYVEEGKVMNYLLNREHIQGGSKAKFFLGRGFERNEWQQFANALSQHAKDNSVKHIKENPFGLSYTIDCNCPTPDRSNPCIRTVWEVRSNDTRPRLITAHPLG